MKRVIFLFLLSALVTHTGLAQIEFGPRVAAVSSEIHLDGHFLIPVDNRGRQTGFQVGFYLREKLPLKGWYIQPEMLYGRLNSMFFVDVFTFDTRLTRLDAPILIGKKLGPVRLNAGPLFRYVIKGEARDQARFFDITESLETFRVWWQVGIGTDIKGFAIDLKYGKGRTAFGSQSSLSALTINSKRDDWVIAVGYRLIK